MKFSTVTVDGSQGLLWAAHAMREGVDDMELPTDDELRQMIDDAVRQVESMMADFDMDEFIRQSAEYIDRTLRDG